MILQNAFLLLLAALMTGCSTTSYTVGTRSSAPAKYVILSVRDSSLIVLPEEYQYELTPEVLREYGRKIPIDSITLLRKQTSPNALALGVLTGMTIGGATAYQLAGHSVGQNSDPGQRALVGSFIGMIPGAILGLAASKDEKTMMPPQNHLGEIRRDIKK